MKGIIRRLRKSVCLAGIVFRIMVTQGRKRFILIGSPLHGNIGDHAISIAERKFLSAYFSDAAIVEIAGVDFRYFSKWLPKMACAMDRILITGGGFMGNLWLNEEQMIRQVIRGFPDNPIFILPQTVYYSNDKDGADELKQSKQIYDRHKNLNIFLREQQSCQFARVNFPRAKLVECVPDMVLYLDLTTTNVKRTGILICFREDKEKKLDNIEREQLLKYLCEKYGETVRTTTVLDRDISFREREQVFYGKIKEFQNSRLVVTDRLHGMLFAAITGTPCIAMDNLSGKVKGVYEWVSHLDYIKYAQSIEEVARYADVLFYMENCRYDRRQLRCSLEKIAERMR